MSDSSASSVSSTTARVPDAPHERGAAEQQHDEHGVAPRPQLPLVVERQSRLDQERIRHQPDHAAEVARPVQEVRVAPGRVVRVRQPALQQRGGRGDDEERQADRHREQAEQRQRRVPARGVGGDRGHAERQDDRRQEQQDGVKAERAVRAELGRGDVRVQVPEQEHGLEEHERDRPHRRRAAERRQHEARHHRLDREQQHGADQHRQREEGDDTAVALLPCGCGRGAHART